MKWFYKWYCKESRTWVVWDTLTAAILENGAIIEDTTDEFGIRYLKFENGRNVIRWDH